MAACKYCLFIILSSKETFFFKQKKLNSNHSFEHNFPGLIYIYIYPKIYKYKTGLDQLVIDEFTK